MRDSLETLLPILLPRAIHWVNEQSQHILDTGEALSERGVQIARLVGVSAPEHIRVSVVSSLPLPDDPELRNVAIQTGLLGPGMVGVTYGYGIYMCDGSLSNRLLSHECRHVAQYEEAGSIENFLPIYLQQIVQFGYRDAPYEVDARQHEIDVV